MFPSFGGPNKVHYNKHLEKKGTKTVPPGVLLLQTVPFFPQGILLCEKSTPLLKGYQKCMPTGTKLCP